MPRVLLSGSHDAIAFNWKTSWGYQLITIDQSWRFFSIMTSSMFVTHPHRAWESRLAYQTFFLEKLLICDRISRTRVCKRNFEPLLGFQCELCFFLALHNKFRWICNFWFVAKAGHVPNRQLRLPVRFICPTIRAAILHTQISLICVWLK